MLSNGPRRSALDHLRRRSARRLFVLARWILGRGINCYERSIISPVVLRMVLFAVRSLERAATILLYGRGLHDGHKRPGGSERR
jgi:hypothetical protein